MEGGAVGHNFERDTPRDHLCQVWLHLAKLFQRRRFVKIYLACNFKVNLIIHLKVIALFSSNFKNVNTFHPLFQKL
jgi:hypothetical protein